MDKYIEEGALRLEWQDFPYLGQESVNASLAARAAQEQGKFWEYHDILYENQGAPNSGVFSDENLLRFAREAELDLELFEESLRSGRYEPVVQRIFREALETGIPGTPTLVVNGRPLVGAQPSEVFERVIEKEAEGAS